MSAWSLIFKGAAIGNLGQHTEVQDNGIPVFDHRLEVFEQVISVPQMSCCTAESVDR